MLGSRFPHHPPWHSVMCPRPLRRLPQWAGLLSPADFLHFVRFSPPTTTLIYPRSSPHRLCRPHSAAPLFALVVCWSTPRSCPVFCRTLQTHYLLGQLPAS